MRALALLAFFFIGARVLLQARTLEVPTQVFPTIQSAIDSCANGDTIFVLAGRYTEALRITDRSLTIIGEFPPDSGNGTGVIIDPAGLDSSAYRACLTVNSGDSVRLERLWFRNGEQMHIGRPVNRTGGIENRTGARALSFHECRFDSVYSGIRGGSSLSLSHVTMRDMRWLAVFSDDSTRIIANDCQFQGEASQSLILSASGSQFTRCSFRNDEAAPILIAGTDSILISRCEFGPHTSECGTGVIVSAGTGTVIEDNLFHDFAIGGAALLVRQTGCAATTGPNYVPARVEGNTFTRILWNGCAGGFGLEFECDGPEPAMLGTVDDNTFVDIISSGVTATAIYVGTGTISLTGNLFERLGPGSGATIYGHGIQPPETLLIRTSSFRDVVQGVEHESGSQYTDARWNWWGAESGPYNDNLNPDGDGASVDDNVAFVPWLTTDPHEDTSEVAVETPPSIASLYSLRAYPNPFNAVTMLDIEVQVPGDYDLILYDVTGRETARVFSGRIERSARVALNASDFASGVYFVKLSSGNKMFAVEKVLLVK